MRKLLTVITACLLGGMLWAQTGQVPVPTRHTVSFESQHGEAFTVFIDGELMNRMPQTRVLVNEISNQTHEVVVILKRPADKAAVLSLRPGESNVIVNVNYDPRQGQLYLYTPRHNRGDAEDLFAQYGFANGNANRPSTTDAEATLPDENPADVQLSDVSDDELWGMIVRMKSQSFDSDRLALGKTLVAASHMTAEQIARLAETIDFSNSQVDFLKYAYAYCVDKSNYYQAANVLTFSSDKKKVLDYIATQR